MNFNNYLINHLNVSVTCYLCLYVEEMTNTSFKSLFHNTIGSKASLYTGNKPTYIHAI